MAQRRVRTSKRAIEAAQKKAETLELRLAGATLQQIGDRLYRGDRSNAHRALTEAIAELPFERAEEVRALELERLNAMMLGAWKRARSGDHQAIASVIKIMERRAKLLGLDAPTQVDATTDANINVIFDGAMMPTGMAEAELLVDPPLDGH